MTQRRIVVAMAVVALGVAAVALGFSPFARGTQSDEPLPVDGDRFNFPLEVVDDQPASNPHADESARGGAPVTRGPFRSYQVNVGPGGGNISGDAANEPSIAVDPTDPSRIAIGWRQFDTISSNFRQAGVAYSQDGGLSWTFPGVLTPGTFRSDPVLASDRNGVFYYYSLEGDFTCDMFVSNDGGQTWSLPTEARGGDKAWFTIDRTNGFGTGNQYIDWSLFAGCCGSDTFTRSTDDGQTYETPLPSPQDIVWGTLAVAANGDLYLCGRSPSSTSVQYVARSTNAWDSNQTPSFSQVVQVNLGGSLGISTGPNPSGLLGQMWVATDPGNSNRVYALCSINPSGSDPLDVMFTRSDDAGATWSSPIRINDDAAGTDAYQWFGTMSVAPNGRIDVIWNDTRDDPTVTFSELYYSYSNDGGTTWSENTPVTPAFNHFLGYPNQSKLGDYYHAVSDAAAMNLAFAATFHGEQDVYFTRLGDCNDNGVHDSQDIADGTSRDCNGNGIPDACDIEAGTASDANGNGVIDECELDLTGPDPGTVGTVNSLTVTGATPGAAIQFWVGKSAGSTAVENCEGVVLNMNNPKLARTQGADGAGEVSVSGFIGVGKSGKTFYFQVVEPSTCNASEVIIYTFP